jgi:apolipoprotein N-acyltransferase
MTVELAGKPWSFGALVCYEDIFPHLSREMVRAGADVLYVATNNAWYGKEAGAYQHAAHSVLRAAELRRPVLRCGNSGWSGWIDARGRIRHVFLPDNNTTIYAGGWSVVPFRSEVGRDAPLTVYARWGDWFVSLCGALVVLGAVPARRAKSRAQA